MLDLDTATINRAITAVQASLDQAQNEDGPAALANRERWDLVDGPVFSTRHMDDDALREAVVTDLVVAEELRRGGLRFAFTAETLVRHLSAGEAARVRIALADPMVASFLERRTDGEVRIDSAHIQDACDYCGVWPEGIEPLTAETVYVAGTLRPLP